jgi:hypothetical protein
MRRSGVRFISPAPIVKGKPAISLIAGFFFADVTVDVRNLEPCMDLKEFVAASLTQIVQGVAESAAAISQAGGAVSPVFYVVSGESGHLGNSKDGSASPVYPVKFDVAVVASSGSHHPREQGVGQLHYEAGLVVRAARSSSTQDSPSMMYGPQGTCARACTTSGYHAVQVRPVLCSQFHVAASEPRQRAVAIELDLVQPCRVSEPFAPGAASMGAGWECSCPPKKGYRRLEALAAKLASSTRTVISLCAP